MDFESLTKLWADKALLKDVAAAILVLVAGTAAYVIFCRVVRSYLARLAKRTKVRWDDILVSNKVFSRVGLLIPAMVVYWGIGFFPSLEEVVRQLLTVYVVFVGLLIVDKVLTVLVQVYEAYPVARHRPVRSFVQLVKLFFFIIGFVVIIALLLGKSPWGILSGVGALTAVLMLVFKDTLLAIVASIQIAANDLIRKGDWVEYPSMGADGAVIDIALHQVLIQNWDKTIVAVPSYRFIDGSFKNWRGMSESGGRRIKRALNLDLASIRFVDEALLAELKKIQLLKPYLDTRMSEVEEDNKAKGIDPASPLNGRRLTNMGCFKAYVEAYLHANTKLRKDMTFLVRHLAPTAEGLPLEIYVFTADTVWANYEAIQADIFDHLIAAVPIFGLRVFQSPSGRDIASIGN